MNLSVNRNNIKYMMRFIAYSILFLGIWSTYSTVETHIEKGLTEPIVRYSICLVITSLGFVGYMYYDKIDKNTALAIFGSIQISLGVLFLAFALDAFIFNGENNMVLTGLVSGALFSGSGVVCVALFFKHLKFMRKNEKN